MTNHTMTKEEAKQLKKGDEVLVKAVFDCIATDGDAYVRFSWTNCRGARVLGNIAVTIDSVLLHSDLQQPAEKPKYDPCRKFKKGDIVRMVERMGRMECTAPVDEFFQTRPLTVIEDERIDTNLVKVESEDGRTRLFHWWYLELVTPVEELEPYYVKENASVYEVFNRNENNSSVAIFFKSQYSIEKAKERAEAECDRLNAEYRKEQDNG